jgi:hypothetical protein
LSSELQPAKRKPAAVKTRTIQRRRGEGIIGR